MNKLDKQYTDLLQDILDNGVKKETRNGGTLSVFGRQIRHKMSDGFPILTTKKIPFRLVVTELLWFLKGNTNIKYLLQNDCNIWSGDCYKRYWFNWRPIKEDCGDDLTPYTQEEFINKIKTDDEFAKKWGDLGRIYGFQWRNWGGEIVYAQKGSDNFYINGIDQIQNLINDLKTNPDSRRLMVNAWNVGELDQMVLPPCHYGFQVYTRELSLEERTKILVSRSDNKKDFYDRNGKLIIEEKLVLDESNIPTRAISLMWNQRSVDTGLGLPFNIASYGLLLEIIAKMVNMVPDELIGNLGDVHLYNNHIEPIKEQIGRDYTLEERIERMYEINKKDTEYLFTQTNPSHQLFDNLNVPKRTREPYPLPTLKMNPIFLANLEHKGFDEAINGQVNFELENYQSHPTIKLPLSN